MKYLLLGLLAATSFAHAAQDPLTKPIAEKQVAQLLTPQAPVKVYGNTYFVGFGRLAVALIKTDAGLVLIDGAVPQSVAAVEANIKQLGFRMQDIKYILNTEVHYDHSGGIAALARDSGATVLASTHGAKALRAGRSDKDDPQFGGALHDTPVPAKLRAVRDGEQIRLGGTTITAHYTPGHTPGSTSWTWDSCDNGSCKHVVFGASLNPISADGFKFDPTVTPIFRKTFQTVANLPCDILIPSHPDAAGIDEKLKQLATDPNAMIDPGACRAFAGKYEKLFDARLAKEKS
ncbi:subclass B3 metallo-beta-lactamase [Roseiterribacter gracilis]|uniref:CAU/MBL1b family subclass B3 metallo-beta-lactamase n=1 Tax=Roseiterribacter gracilis TaxID=2812848 RepID=A0A8S8XDF6_9PROT|nr:CAU/MBL1b family subclass B3 metallo-beta-lactamase [Rhodospirillales bacterium TMPK1]